MSLQRVVEIVIDGYKTGYLGFSSFKELGWPQDVESLPFMHRWIAILAPIIFLMMVHLFAPEKNGKTFRHPLLTFASFAHNIILMVFSMSTFYFTGPRFLARILESGDPGLAICETMENDWDVLGFWSYLFYLSKYYEYLDCLLVILKNKRPIQLQTLHHAGAGLLMWGSCLARNPVCTVFVTYNSFIHSLMYLYYAVTALRFYPPVFIKFLMTFLQLCQFFVGVFLSSGKYWVGQCGYDLAQQVITTFMHFYVVGLFIMFSFFAYDTYFKPKPKKDTNSKENVKPKEKID